MKSLLQRKNIDHPRNSSARAVGEPTKKGVTRRGFTALSAAFVAFAAGGLLPSSPAEAQIATKEQRASLTASGQIISAADLISSLEQSGGQVIDLELYLPASQPVSWFYRVIYRDANGRVAQFDIGAVAGDRR